MTRILSLEYDPVVAEFLCAILQGAGYEALATANVHEALSILRTQSIDVLTLGLGTHDVSPPPSLRRILPSEPVMQEWPVPAMNGEEFLRLLKDDACLRHIPVLLLTGYCREACTQFLQKFGLDLDQDVAGYVQKGELFDKELLDSVEIVLNNHRKQLPPEAPQTKR